MKFILFLILIYIGSKVGVDVLWNFIFGDKGDKK